MRFWLVCFSVVFGAAELLPWLTGVDLPVAVFWVAGGLLAIASNSSKLSDLPKLQLASKNAEQAPSKHQASTKVISAPASAAPTSAMPTSATSSASARSSPELPKLTPPQPSKRPISFTIKKPSYKP